MSIASLYPSINPSLLLDFANSKVLDSRVTFTRTTTATYYDGVTTAVAEQNLLTYSQEFDNAAWTQRSVTVSANSTTAPDGTSTADTITPQTNNDYHYIYLASTPSGATNTCLSVYAKTNGYNNFFIRSNTGGTYRGVNFNISTGVVNAVENGASGTITSVGNGWYRCSVIFTGYTLSSQTQFLVAPDATGNADTQWVGNGTSGIYLWGAQLEQRSSATAYTATTSQAITNYIPVLQTASAGQARFDHNPTTGESLGLLIEEARTNLATYSESIGAWVPQTATVQDNQAVAPNGTLTAEKVIPSSTGANRGCYTSFTASGVTTISIYVKYGGYQWVRLLGPAAANSVWFDVLNGVKGTEGSGVTGTITAVGNGWYRISVTQSQTGTSYVQVNLASADNSTSVTVATNDVFSGVFLWGAQAETGGASFATSYIPNLSTGSTTRNADAASMTGTNFSSWFNYGAMTIYAEATGYEAGSYDIIDLDSGSNTGRIRTRFASDYQVDQLDASVAQTFSLDGGSVTAKSFAKIAAGLTQNSQALSLNGGSVATATAPFTTQPAPTTARIGSNFAGSNYLNGTIKKIAFYPVKATNAQLQALTV